MMVKPLTDRKWRGYTFEQLQDERILNDARIAIQKSLIDENVKNLKSGFTIKGTSKKILSVLGYTDYIMLGIAALRRLRPVFRFLRRKKNKK